MEKIFLPTAIEEIHIQVREKFTTYEVSDVPPEKNKEITIGTWFCYRSTREMVNDMVVPRVDDRIDT